MAINKEREYVMNENYNEHSRPQLDAADSTQQYIRDAINALDTQHSSSPLIIADFGSAQGGNSIYVMKMIIHYLKEKKKVKDDQEILVVHNDLPMNGWTTLFNRLNNDFSYYGVANGRSFYSSCLPRNSLSIGYSSTALHWLSHKPCNISNHCASLFAQGDELKAFQEQSRLDWIHFLQHRSDELIPGGVLILLIPSVDDQGSNGFDILRELLYKCAQSILHSQELLDYTFPIHARSYSDCVDDELFTCYSFEIIKADFGSVQMPFIDQLKKQEITMDGFLQSLTLYVRSWSESILQDALVLNHRSNEDIDKIQHQFWSTFEYELKNELDQLLNMYMNFTYLVLKKKY